MVKGLFDSDLQVINVGVESFAGSIQAAGGAATHLDWAPPAQGDREAGMSLAKLVNRPEIEEANRTALDRYLAARPVLVGVDLAGKVIPGMGERTLLHAGPPVTFENMCGPMQGAVIGAILLEGWAADDRAARQLAASGDITFDPCHHHAAVGPMAGLVSPSMPVWIIQNAEHGNMAYSTMNEGLGKVLRYGAYAPAVLDKLRWMGGVLGPAMAAALKNLDGVELKPLIAQALHMGDECHNRNVAASSLLFKKLTPAILKTDLTPSEMAAALDFIVANDFYFLNIGMAACKSMLDAAHGVPNSSMVTAMARNGVEFGIRVSGAGDAWFTAPAPSVEGLYFAGFTAADAAQDLGDSAITETAGIGGFAMGTAPAVVQFVGGTPQMAIGFTREMAHITLGQNSAFTLPPLGFSGTPAGIDVRKVVDTGITPVINTGIAHREAGIGQVGAGLTRAPLACFTQAVKTLASGF
jgi:hypothetical protein